MNQTNTEKASCLIGPDSKASSNSEDYYDYDSDFGQGDTEYRYTVAFFPIQKSDKFDEVEVWRISLHAAALAKILSQTYQAAHSRMNILAAIGARTSFDCASEILNIPTNLSFERKLDQLRDSGFITPRDRTKLETLVEAGSAAAHRGWEPNDDEVSVIITVLNEFLKAHIIKTQDLEELKKRIPTRERK